jgi:hypothetical protein
MPIRCEIVSQDRTIFEGEADIVVLPGGEGEMVRRYSCSAWRKGRYLYSFRWYC